MSIVKLIRNMALCMPIQARICCGLSLGVNFHWEVDEFNRELQDVIEKYRHKFDGGQEGFLLFHKMHCLY